ncbi:GPI anchored cell surface protein [Schizosaccharomyces japonicus yFS275]|uniref:GPI anchored cell surface protein n=1 Tax=Schizosaccharomyces japonicus (strain yFS275 / FY16936) TaxID=402676 RepID=B6K4C7_SCHJY|nr:GPI anchored cell surface protein [Schizosaccharomyces japonicus yFS275]EEB08334.1 GPI anchored cell surface protein [Schizosaccharomyces japonicus yFS275]
MLSASSFLLLAILQLFTLALGNPTCGASEHVITSQNDLDVLSGCKILNGSIFMNSSSATSLTFNNIEQIGGDVVISNNFYLASLSMPHLKSISGIFRLEKLTRLSSLYAPQLTKVRDLRMKVLPNLQVSHFDKGISDAQNVLVEDTQLSTLDGISLSAADNFVIVNNNYLREVKMPALKKVSGKLYVSYNAKDVRVYFPKLEETSDFTLQRVSVADLSSLSKVHGSLGFLNSTMTEINCPNITKIDQSLFFVGNTELQTVRLPKLKVLGGTFMIYNNQKHRTVDGFESLETIGGAIDCSGNFSSISLPELRDVKGGLNIQTTASNFTCPFKYHDGTVKGKSFVCRGSILDPKSSKETTLTNDILEDEGHSTSATTTTGTSRKKASKEESAAFSIRFPATLFLASMGCILAVSLDVTGFLS